MAKYNSFYFFHIDKTIGRLTNFNLIQPMYENMESAGIDTSLNKYHNLHNRWRNLDEQCYIFSAVREPVDRTISEFVYLMNYDAFGELKPDASQGPAQTVVQNLTLDNFERWLYTSHTANFQSRSFLSGDPYMNENALSERVKRVNLLIRAENITHPQNQIILQNKILSDLNMNIKITKTPAYPEGVWYDNSRYFGFYSEVKSSSLSQKILDLNIIDSNLFNFKYSRSDQIIQF